MSEGLKRITNEKPPNYKLGDKKHSFPSGHAVGAFSGASYIHKRYSFAESIPFYALASFTAYSRVQAKKHHIHDVLAGAALGIGVSWLVVSEKVSVIPAGNDGAMLNYQKEF